MRRLQFHGLHRKFTFISQLWHKCVYIIQPWVFKVYRQSLLEYLLNTYYVPDLDLSIALMYITSFKNGCKTLSGQVWFTKTNTFSFKIEIYTENDKFDHTYCICPFSELCTL